MIELKLLVAAISRVLDDMTGNKSCGKAMMTKNVDGMYEGSGALVVRVASGVGPSTTGSELGGGHPYEQLQHVAPCRFARRHVPKYHGAEEVDLGLVELPRR